MEQVTIYEQLTISDWLTMKEKLRLELQNVTQSFVRIGYALRKIDDEKMYETDGCKSIAEFAKKEYGLEASTVSRFMAINREYSEGGYSERLREEYTGYGQSKLSEMLQLPDKDRELITPQMQRADIRELKDFNRTEPEGGKADDIQSLIESYFHDNKKDLNELYGMAENNHADDGHIVSIDVKEAIDLLNPSGTKVYRKGLYMLFFYDENVKIKKFCEDAVTHTWGDFLAAVDEIFGPAAAGYHTWERYFGEDLSDAMNKPEEQTKGVEEKEDGRTGTAAAAEGETAGIEGKELEETAAERTGEDPGRDQSGRSGDPEMGACGEIGRSLSAGSGDEEETGPGGEEEDRGANCDNQGNEESDEQRSGSYSADSGDESGAEKEGTEGIAPAQEAEPAAADKIEPKHRQGDRILVEGVIEMVTVGANKAVNYRIRTKGGKTVWVIEEDIVEETV